MPPTTQSIVAKEVIANLKLIGISAIAFVLLLLLANNTDLKSDVPDLLLIMMLYLIIFIYVDVFE